MSASGRSNVGYFYSSERRASRAGAALGRKPQGRDEAAAPGWIVMPRLRS
jgi:hypothetical protein